MRELGVPERQPTPATFPCGHDRADHGRPKSDKRYLYCYTCALAKKRAETDALREAQGRVKRGNPAVFPCGHRRTPDNTRVAGTCRTCANAAQSLRAKEWRRANPQAAKEQSASGYRARKIARGDDDTLAWLDLIREDPCSYCGERSETVDHIEPKVHGGVNHWTNYAPACRSCNSSKNDQSLLLYLLRRRAPA